MINVTWKERPNFERDLHNHIDKLIEAAANEAASLLRVRISAGVRTGRKYSRYPRRSSKVGEYPQQQFSKLMNSVQAQQVRKMKYKIGFLGDDIVKLMQLEYGLDSVPTNNPPMNRGYYKGQRKPLYKLLVGKDGKATRKAMLNAAQAAA
jgi:hypothetical protein